MRYDIMKYLNLAIIYYKHFPEVLYSPANGLSFPIARNVDVGR